jgi:hypothetical protein
MFYPLELKYLKDFCVFVFSINCQRKISWVKAFSLQFFGSFFNEAFRFSKLSFFYQGLKGFKEIAFSANATVSLSCLQIAVYQCFDTQLPYAIALIPTP